MVYAVQNIRESEITNIVRKVLTEFLRQTIQVKVPGLLKVCRFLDPGERTGLSGFEEGVGKYDLPS